MIKVTLQKEKPFPLSAKVVSHAVVETFRINGITSQAEASIYIVTRETMLEYVKKHLNETGEEAASHPVLSFVNTEIEGPFQFPPDETLHLGEIIVSFDHAKEEAERLHKTPEECVIELAQHAALHLMGIHHE